MNKNIIALAVAAAVASPMAATAEVKIGGQVHYSWDFVDTNDAANDDSDDVTGVDRASRLNFSGSEDLGDGLTAFWNWQVQLDSNDGVTANRNTYAGLKGGWGQVRLGRHDTPYKISTGSLDVFSDTVADYNSIVGRTNGGIGFDERAPQMVAYISPTFNGFHAAIARASHKINEGAGPGDDENEAWSMMGMYNNGPLFASLAYETQSGGTLQAVTGNGGLTRASDGADSWKLGLGYKFGSSKIGFIYEDISSDASNDPIERDAFYINFAHAFGANTFKIAYGDADDGGGPGSSGADTWAIGLDHAFSKRTNIYAVYATMDNDGAATYGLFGGNAVTAAGAPGMYAASGPGNDVDAFSVGIKHKF